MISGQMSSLSQLCAGDALGLKLAALCYVFYFIFVITYAGGSCA